MEEGRGSVVLISTSTSDIRCFKGLFPTECGHFSNRAVELTHVLAQVERGGFACPQCGMRLDLQTAGLFTEFGYKEGIFGLTTLTFIKEIPSTTTMQVIQIDLPQLSAEWRIHYCSVSTTFLGEFGGFDEIPFLLAPSSMHQYWGLPLRACVPAGRERRLTLSLVGKSEELPQPLELGLQACELLGRGQYPTACVLIAASVEASLRTAIERAFIARSITMPENTGFAKLLELARMLIEPKMGSQLVGNLKRLAKEGRNPAAHGGANPTVTHDEVAHWLVDAALVYEWSVNAKFEAS